MRSTCGPAVGETVAERSNVERAHRGSTRVTLQSVQVRAARRARARGCHGRREKISPADNEPRASSPRTFKRAGFGRRMPPLSFPQSYGNLTPAERADQRHSRRLVVNGRRRRLAHSCVARCASAMRFIAPCGRDCDTNGDRKIRASVLTFV